MEPQELKPDRKSLTLLISGLLIGATAVFFALNSGQINQNTASQGLVSILEESSGDELELVNTEKESGLYKVQVRDSNNNLLTYYMTSDGNYITQESNLIDYNQFKSRVSAQGEFSQCLLDKDVVMFGNRSQRATVSQIQVLGGPNRASDFYADVNNNQTLRQAVELGVSRLPAFYYNGSIKQGVQSINQLEEFTGCNYPMETEG